MKSLLSISLTVLNFFMASQAMAMGAKNVPLETATHVDLSRYVGKWYEIARLPQIFEKDCVGVTAEYTALTGNNEGKIRVTNTCHKNSCSGKVNVANGLARLPDAAVTSKLLVSFFWPFEGDYWILKLNENYEYAVVGSPDRKSLWILSRTPKMNESLLNEIYSEFAAKGFDTGSMLATEACE